MNAIFENFVITGEPDPAWQQAGAKIIRDRVEKAKNSLKPLEIPEPTSSWISTIRKHFENKFSRLGITEVNWPTYVVMTNSSSEDPESNGHVEPGMIVLHDINRDIPRALSAFQQARVIAQELYHGSAPEFYSFRRHAGVRKNIEFDRRGMVYGGGHAFEEGLAALAVSETYGELQEKYPVGFQLFLKLYNSLDIADKNPVLNSLLNYNPELAVTLFDFSSVKDGKVEITLRNVNSVFMTAYIKSVIGKDFDKLVEISRQKGDDSGIKSTLENAFGRGAFELIKLAYDDTALDVTRTLSANRLKHK